MQFIHTTDAIWTCDLCDALGTERRLRSAVIIVTPFARIFQEFPDYRPLAQREEAAAEFIRDAYLKEVWYRKPRVIESPCQGLIAILREFELRPSFRECKPTTRLMTAHKDFERRCAVVSRPRYLAG